MNHLSKIKDQFKNEIEIFKQRIIKLRAVVKNCNSKKKVNLHEETKERYDALFHRSLDCIYIHDFDGNFLEANKSALNLLGYTSEEVTTLNLSDILLPEELQIVKERIIKIINNQIDDTTYQYVLKHKNSSFVFVETKSSVLYKNGKPYAIQGIARDITKHIDLKNKLSRSNEYYSSLMEQAVDGILVMNSCGSIIDVNPSACSITGYSDEELKKMKIYDLMADDNQILIPPLSERLKFGKHLSIESQLIRKDGNFIYSEFRIKNLSDGKMFAFLRDVTDKKVFEKKIKLSEERYIKLFQASSNMIGLTELDNGKFIEINEASSHLTGYSREEFLTDNSISRKLWQNSEKREKYVELLKVYEKVRDFEVEFVKKSGELRKFLINADLVTINNQKFILAICHDITERKLAELALKVSEEKFRTLVEQIPAITYMSAFDEISSTIYISPQVETILKYPQKDFITRPGLWSDLLHPDDKEKVLNQYKLIGSDNSNFVIEYRMVSSEGNYLWFRDEGKLVCDSSKKPLFVQGIMIEITEKKVTEIALREYEQRINLILNSFPLVFFTINTDNFNYVKWVSNNIINITGFPDSRFSNEENFWKDRVHPDDFNGIIDLSYYKMGIGIKEFRWLCSDNKYKWFLCYAYLITDTNGNIKEIVGLWLDINERKIAEEKFHRSEEQLRALAVHLETIREEERSTIAREVHDELGQALTALKMVALSIKKNLPRDNEKLIAKTRDMIDLISGMIHSVQHITFLLRPQALDSFGLIAAIEWYMEEYKKRTEIDYKIDVFCLEEIELDDRVSISVYRVFQEALTNIARHADATLVKITISGVENLLLLEISDNGKGISSNSLVDENSFGLIGMKERMLMAGGEIFIEGKKNSGTKITMKIPINN